ncbi:molybdenum cofactor guanylyltransferase [Paenibacillus aceris]|uniref:Probable molybdenum cofactor guanylyltransferase n=1 Tax=Paenibacillus aceris TaxID=869555 RepID=A0ABS4HXL5_9BACL|nr:molybdenum cofactor guanylyltransferase [Paenibacillus aceris]MBP1962679.1 molybdopterin-guanine dinucleotide biosynthesis protein A [Paenibacillus aceris]NHW37487.1 molybdenum cofactor guanylyltransferase [Paenibacillus aceris]
MMTGVILAGGLNRRMGGNRKALLPVEGQPILLRQLKEMSKICNQIIVVANESEAFIPLIESMPSTMNVQLVSDYYVQKGPLSGIHAAAQAASHEFLWIVGCDMPFLSSEAAAAMAQWCQEANVDAVIPVLEGKVHPLHGIYSRLVGSEAEVLLKQEKYRLMGLLDHIDWLPAENVFFENHHLPTQFVTNVNTPEEYNAMLDNLT